MNVSSDKPYTIFRKDYKNSVFYKVGLSRKKEDGMYENGYVDIRFKKGIELKNKTQIYLKDAFLSFYLTKDKHTIPYIFVLDYELVADAIERSKETDIVKQDTKDEYKGLGSSVKLEDLDIDPELPF